MFALTPDDLSGRILDCASGPGSFNAELSAEGRKIISCDPLYRFTADEIHSRIDAAYDTMLSNVRAASDEFVWREFASPENLGEARMAAMETFLADFPLGTAEGRYLERSLPHLGFREGEFDLALSSHFLFTYSDRLSIEFHVAAIEEMCRVAAEVRVFPLMRSYGGRSPRLEPVMDNLRGRGYRAEVRRVPYEFQRGGDKMLVASAD
jgi:SAM-dependent methyltransferase